MGRQRTTEPGSPLGKRILHLIGDSTLADWADWVGESQQNVSRYVAGRSPGAAFFERAASKGVNTNWLLTGHGEPFVTNGATGTMAEGRISDHGAGYAVTEMIEPLSARLARLQRQAQDLEQQVQESSVHEITIAPKGSADAWQIGDDTPDCYQCVPYHSGSAAAGAGYVVDEEQQGVVIVHRRCIPQNHRLSAVRVRGDSMEPVITDGAIIVVDHDDRDPKSITKRPRKSHRIVVARIDDLCTVKFLSLSDGTCILTPANPEYDPRIVQADSIIGRVVFVASDLYSGT